MRLNLNITRSDDISMSDTSAFVQTCLINALQDAAVGKPQVAIFLHTKLTNDCIALGTTKPEAFDIDHTFTR